MYFLIYVYNLNLKTSIKKRPRGVLFNIGIWCMAWQPIYQTWSIYYSYCITDITHQPKKQPIWATNSTLAKITRKQEKKATSKFKADTKSCEVQPRTRERERENFCYIYITNKYSKLVNLMNSYPCPISSIAYIGVT